MGRKRVAVILLAHGEAETTSFIENYRVSRHTLERAARVMPVPSFLQQLIPITASLRKKLIPGTASASPQNALTRLQAKLLQERLDHHPASNHALFRVMPAFSACEPTVESLLEESRDYDAQIVFPMAPIDNTLICGLLCQDIAEKYAPGKLHRIRVIGRPWADPDLFGVYIRHLFESARPLPRSSGKEELLMLLFHGTIVKDGNGAAPAFHTGLDETLAFARHLTAAIEADTRNSWGKVVTAFLNHEVGGEWTRPSFEESCRAIDPERTAGVTLFAAGYFADGNETVNRAEHFGRLVPSLRAGQISCLNDSPAFTEWLAGRVTAAVAQIFVFSGDRFL